MGEKGENKGENEPIYQVFLQKTILKTHQEDNPSIPEKKISKMKRESLNEKKKHKVVNRMNYTYSCQL